MFDFPHYDANHTLSPERCLVRSIPLVPINHQHQDWPSLMFLGPGPLFTEWTDILPHKLLKSWSLEIWVCSFPMAMKFDRAEMLVRAIWPLQHQISRPRDFKRFGRKTSYRLVNRSPGVTNALLINVFTMVENGVWYSWTSWVEHVTGLAL